MKETITYKKLFAILAILFLTIPSYGQTTTKESDSVAIISHIPVAEIPAQIETFTARSKNIEKNIQPSAEIIIIDSTFLETKKYLDQLKSDFDELVIADLDLRKTENKKREWLNYQQSLISMRSKISDRNKQLQAIFEEINVNEDIWKKTRDYAHEKKVASEIINSTEEVLSNIEALRKKTKTQQDQVFIIYKNITDEITIVEEVIATLNTRIKELQSMFFVQDSPPIWNAIDSTSTLSFFKRTFAQTINENARVINVYFFTNLSTFYYQLVFIFLIIILFLYLKRKMGSASINEQNRDEVKAAIIIKKPVSSALVLGMLVSLFFFVNRPMSIVEFYLIIYMIPLTILASCLIEKERKKLLYILVGLFVVDIIQSYLNIYAFSNRVLFIIIAAITLHFLLQIHNYRKRLKNKPVKWFGKLINFVSLLYLIVIVVSVIGNILGSVGFTSLLLNGVIRSLMFALVAGVMVIILTSILVISTKESKGLPYFSISKYQNLLLKRIKPLIDFSGFIFWVYATLTTFGVYEYLLVWIGEVMDITWILGKVEISLGGIIMFFIILTITFVLVRLVKIIFTDDWVKRSKIPRGVPQAISMTLRYFITGFGIYLALSAAGVDLGNFGLMAGALGVGIGFGLQGIVSNFIAGLVLSYERPIHVGDTIEVNTLMGNVTEIGVRASKVQTFDGSEVIVPNNELISKQVINWTLSNEQRRLKIQVRTSLDADPRIVMKLLREIATTHPNTLPNPEPMILFDGYGNTSLDFTVYLWVYFNVSFGTRSDIALKIYDAIKEAGYDVPIPLQKIHYISDEKIKKGTLPQSEKEMGEV